MNRIKRVCAIAALVLGPRLLWADGVQPIVPSAGVLYGSNAKTIISSASVVYVDTTTISFNAKKGINTNQIKFNDGTVFTSTSGIVGLNNGIVSPGTFTWTNTGFGLSVSTIAVSTVTVSGRIVLKDGSVITSTAPFTPITPPAIYPATGTPSFPFGISVSSISVSTVNVSGQIVFLDNTVINTTSTILNGAILNQGTLQAGASFYVYLGSATNLNAQNIQMNDFRSTGLFPDPDAMKIIGQTGVNKCIGWWDATNTNVYAMCRNGTSFQIGTKSVTGGMASFMTLGTNGSFPTGSTVTIGVPLIIQNGFTTQSGVNRLVNGTLGVSGNAVVTVSTDLAGPYFLSVSTYGPVNIWNLTPSRFVSTDGNKNLVSTDLFGGNNIWTGTNLVSSSNGLGVTYGVAAGSVQVTGLLGVGPLRGGPSVTISTGPINLATEVAGNLSTSSLNAGSGATSATFWRGDGTWAVPNNATAGSTALAVTTGSGSGFSSIASSPTAIINAEQTQFNVQLKGGATAYLSLNQSSVTLQGNSFNAANKLVQLSGSSQLPAVDGNLLTNLNGTQILSGTIPSAALGNAILNQATLQSGATFYVSSGTLTTQLNLPYVGSGQVLFPGSDSKVQGSSSFVWDTANSVLNLGASASDPSSWLTVNGSALNPILIHTATNDTAGLVVTAPRDVRTWAGSSPGIASYAFCIKGGGGLCPSYTATGDASLVAGNTPIPPTAHGSRLWLSAYAYADNAGAGSANPPQMVIASSGIVFNTGPYPFIGQTPNSNPVAPVQVGYGSRNPNLRSQKIVMDYPGDSSLVAIDSGTGAAGMFGVISGTITIGSTSTFPVQLIQNGAVKATITSGGDWGFGTTFPVARYEFSPGNGKTLQISNGSVNLPSDVRILGAGSGLGGTQGLQTSMTCEAGSSCWSIQDFEAKNAQFHYYDLSHLNAEYTASQRLGAYSFQNFIASTNTALGYYGLDVEPTFTNMSAAGVPMYGVYSNIKDTTSIANTDYGFYTDMSGVTSSSSTKIAAALSGGPVLIGTTNLIAQTTAQLTVVAPTSLPYDIAIGTSTTSKVFHLAVSTSAHIITSGPSPAVSACGGTPSVIGTDSAGIITAGSGSVTSCTLTFANTYGSGCTVACAISQSSQVSAVFANTTATTLTLGSSISFNGLTFGYVCQGVGPTCR